MEQSLKEYWKVCEQGETFSIQFCVTWALILLVRYLREDINHDKDIANSLNEYKLDDQID